MNYHKRANNYTICDLRQTTCRVFWARDPRLEKKNMFSQFRKKKIRSNDPQTYSPSISPLLPISPICFTEGAVQQMALLLGKRKKRTRKRKRKKERATALRSRNIFQRGTAQSVNTICNSLEDKRETVFFSLPVSDEIDYMEKMYTHLSIYLCFHIYLYSHLHKQVEVHLEGCG